VVGFAALPITFDFCFSFFSNKDINEFSYFLMLLLPLLALCFELGLAAA
jgi:hypothetical protein